MQCPRCRSLATEREMREVVYEKSQQMVIVEGKDSKDVFVPVSVAEKLGLDGPTVWVRKEARKRVCPACCEELQRGRYAHSSTKGSGAWARKG